MAEIETWENGGSKQDWGFIGGGGIKQGLTVMYIISILSSSHISSFMSHLK